MKCVEGVWESRRQCLSSGEGCPPSSDIALRMNFDTAKKERGKKEILASLTRALYSQPAAASVSTARAKDTLGARALFLSFLFLLDRITNRA